MTRSRQAAFIITIDTEGDNIWTQRCGVANTRNALFLPRFQDLCEKYGLKPSYLVNHEMAMSGAFCEFARDAQARGHAEVGMHLHAWDSPPLVQLTDADHRHHPFLIDFPIKVMREKIARMTGLLEQRFGRPVRSHRAGRWAFNEAYARLLAERGYCVDCSVTPGVSWQYTQGAPGHYGTDYTQFPQRPYFLDLSDISKAGSSPLLEVPMTIRSSWFKRYAPALYSGVTGKVLRRFSRETTWLRPDGENEDDILDVTRWALLQGHPHVEFMLHSSELMPGGSPNFVDAAAVDRVYEHIEMLFAYVARHCVGATLSDYHARVVAAGGGHLRWRPAPV
jgi:hypothetical protein